MAISCICHYRPAHKLVTAHLECRAPSQRDLHVLLFLSSSSLLSLSPPSQPFPPPPHRRRCRATPEITSLHFLLLCFDLSSLRTSILPVCVVPSRRRGSAVGERRFDHAQVERFARNASHRIVVVVVVVYDRRMDPESSRSLSSLINVVSLLIYRRVAGEPTNEIRRYHARTTLGDTLAGFAR